MTMEQLNQAAQEIQQENGTQEQERFSKYLWKLEQNHEISEEERSSYIGIYRLIAQVEKGDGAALGSVSYTHLDIKKQKSKNCCDTFLIHRHSFGSEYRCIGLLARKIIKVLKLFL